LVCSVCGTPAPADHPGQVELNNQAEQKRKEDLAQAEAARNAASSAPAYSRPAYADRMAGAAGWTLNMGSAIGDAGASLFLQPTGGSHGVYQEARRLHVTPLVEKVKAEMLTDETVQRWWRLQGQHAEAARQAEVSRARIAEVEARRRSVELEAPRDLVARLDALEAELVALRPTLAEAERQVAMLQPLVASAAAEARARLKDALAAAAREAARGLEEEMPAVLGRLLEVIAPVLDQAVANRAGVTLLGRVDLLPLRLEDLTPPAAPVSVIEPEGGSA
jgi:hypothetical protein